MKYLVIICLLLTSVSVQSSNNKKDIKAKEIKELIESQQFRFIARTALPLTGSSINLTSEYDLIIDSLNVRAWLPYFGRAYRAEYGSSEGGIKFKETAEEITYKMDKRKKNYLVSFDIDGDKDYYKINLNIGLSGYATLDVTSTHKQSISFYGIVEPLEEE